MKVDPVTGDVYISVENDTLADIYHVGVGHLDGGHSGRYPWGSGDSAFQRPHDFYSFVRNRLNKGLTELEIAKGLNLSTTEFRSFYSLAKSERRRDLVNDAKKLSKTKNENGQYYTNSEIGKILGEKYNDGKAIGESTIRSYLDADREASMNAAYETAKVLMQQVDEKGIIDIGTKVEHELGVSREKLNQAIIIAEANGYVELYGSVPQQNNPNQKTNIRVLAPAGTPKSAAYDYANINTITDYAALKNSKRRVFISGSSKTQDEESEYYRKELPEQSKKFIDDVIKSNGTVIVGDAPGIDRQVQDYLKSKKYKDVEVYGPGNSLRYLADPDWGQHPVDSSEYETNSKEWLAKKDKVMQRVSNEGYAIVIENNGSSATRANIKSLTNSNKKVSVLELHKDGNDTEKEILPKRISTPDIYSPDNGKTFHKYEYPVAINPDRIMVRYAEEGGKAKDGVIELRPGVKDLSLGKSYYAQVRILVDNGGGEKDRYLKGMAVYSNSEMPDGIDIIVNSNKPLGTPKMDCFKKTKDNLDKDPSNPFGATIKEHSGQYYYDDPEGKFKDPLTGNRRSLGAINKRSDQGDWNEWSKETPSQFLSKQPIDLISKQLNKSIIKRQNEFDEISEIQNPTVRAKMMLDFANNCDSTARDLKACRLPQARYHVILPSRTLKDNEIYAPNYENGTQLALIRFPHEGIFQIPILTVNNNNKECKAMIGPNSDDAVAITAKTANQLSGADFDGDTVIAIPTNRNGIKIQNKSPLEGLKDFDTGVYGPDPIGGIVTDKNGVKHYYRNGIEYKHISEDHKQKMMGIVSNLISDMTLIGAPDDEVARATRFSMTVIDSYKHDLDYLSCYKENDIESLKKKYQQHINDEKYGGASTIVSRAKNEIEVKSRAPGKYILNQEGNKDNGHELKLVDKQKKIFYDPISNKKYTEADKKTVYYDPETGEKLYRETGEFWVNVHMAGVKGRKGIAPAYVKVSDDKFKRYDNNLTVVAKDDNLYYKDPITQKFIKVGPDDKVLEPVYKTEKVAKMDYVNDAYKLSSGTLKEKYYAEYANKLKALANEARKEYMYSEAHAIQYDPEAKAKYKEEYDTLVKKIELAEANAPIERQANLIAAAKVSDWLRSTPDEEHTKDDIQKRRTNELAKARENLGAKRYAFAVTEKEWEAIMAGAISANRLKTILNYANPDIIKQLATPRPTKVLSNAEINRIKGYAAKGETNAVIAKRLGISVSTVSKYLAESEGE